MNRKPELNVVAFQGPADRGAPPKPAAVERDPVRSAEWDRVVALGLVDARHVGILMAYCSAFARVVLLLGKLDAVEDLVIETERGGEKSHPLLSQLNEAERLLATHSAKLGLTPTDGGKVKDGGKTKAAGKKVSKYL
jgi:phage terminase small subunit